MHVPLLYVDSLDFTRLLDLSLDLKKKGESRKVKKNIVCNIIMFLRGNANQKIKELQTGEKKEKKKKRKEKKKKREKGEWREVKMSLSVMKTYFEE